MIFTDNKFVKKCELYVQALIKLKHLFNAIVLPLHQCFVIIYQILFHLFIFLKTFNVLEREEAFLPE